MFLVLHSYESQYGEDVVKTIGIYPSRKVAEQTVIRLVKLPGFSDHSDGFSVNEFEVDEDHWTSDFGGAELDWPMEDR